LQYKHPYKLLPDIKKNIIQLAAICLYLFPILRPKNKLNLNVNKHNPFKPKNKLLAQTSIATMDDHAIQEQILTVAKRINKVTDKESIEELTPLKSLIEHAITLLGISKQEGQVKVITSSFTK
jgi:hypothetical protein